MSKFRILSTVVTILVASGLTAAQAGTMAPTPKPQATIAQPQAAPGTLPALTPAERAQLANEAGISASQASGLRLDQLAWLKMRRDSDDGPWVAGPTKVDPASVHG